MELLIKTDFWKNLNVGFALDEGLANPGPEYMLYYSERLPWWFEITVKGQPGHGSQFLQDTVGEKLNRVVQKFMTFRQGKIFIYHKLYLIIYYSRMKIRIRKQIKNGEE